MCRSAAGISVDEGVIEPAFRRDGLVFELAVRVQPFPGPRGPGKTAKLKPKTMKNLNNRSLNLIKAGSFPDCSCAGLVFGYPSLVCLERLHPASACSAPACPLSLVATPSPVRSRSKWAAGMVVALCNTHPVMSLFYIR